VFDPFKEKAKNNCVRVPGYSEIIPLDPPTLGNERVAESIKANLSSDQLLNTKSKSLLDEVFRPFPNKSFSEAFSVKNGNAMYSLPDGNEKMTSVSFNQILSSQQPSIDYNTLVSKICYEPCSTSRQLPSPYVSPKRYSFEQRTDYTFKKKELDPTEQSDPFYYTPFKSFLQSTEPLPIVRNASGNKRTSIPQFQNIIRSEEKPIVFSSKTNESANLNPKAISTSDKDFFRNIFATHSRDSFTSNKPPANPPLMPHVVRAVNPLNIGFEAQNSFNPIKPVYNEIGRPQAYFLPQPSIVQNPCAKKSSSTPYPFT
jgi:hypothetical protein